MKRRRVPPFPAFPSSEYVSLEVKRAGQIHLPPIVQECLDLQPGDSLSLRRNALSVRLDRYRDLLEDLQRSVRDSDRWGYLGQFLQGPFTSVGAEGSIAIPPDVLELTPGDRFVLEVSEEGVRHPLYLYRADA